MLVFQFEVEPGIDLDAVVRHESVAVTLLLWFILVELLDYRFLLNIIILLNIIS